MKSTMSSTSKSTNLLTRFFHQYKSQHFMANPRFSIAKALVTLLAITSFSFSTASTSFAEGITLTPTTSSLTANVNVPIIPINFTPSGFFPNNFVALDPLPTGLQINSANGEIVGTPTQVSPQSSYKIQGGDGTNSVIATISISVGIRAISSNSLVIVGQVNPVIILNSVNFKTTANEQDFFVDPSNSASLTLDISGVLCTQDSCTVTLTGTATLGSFTIQALNSAFYPTSNDQLPITRTFNVAFSQTAIVGHIVAAGSVFGSTKVTYTVGGGNSLRIIKQPGAVTPPDDGDDVSGISSSYSSGANILGAASGEHLGLYEVNATNDVVAFIDITLASGDIATAVVTFDSNTATSGTMTPQTAAQPASLAALAFTKTDHVFFYWNTQADGLGVTYQPAATYSFDADVTLYAQWGEVFTVIFDGNNATSGSTSSLIGLGSGATLTPNGFTNTGYLFNGWNTQADGSGVGYEEENTWAFNVNLTLYAQWLDTIGSTLTVYNIDDLAESSTAAIEFGETRTITLGLYDRNGDSFTVQSGRVTFQSLFGNTLSGQVTAAETTTVTYTRAIAGVDTIFAYLDGQTLSTTDGLADLSISITSVSTDVAAPALVMAVTTVDGSKIIMTYGEVLSSYTPGFAAFTVLVGSTPKAGYATLINGSTVELWFTTPFVFGDVITLDYVNSLGAVATRDLAGNLAGNFSGIQVANNVPVIARTLTFAPLNAMQVGGTRTVATVLSITGGVTMTSNTTSICTISNFVITAVAVGTCSITASANAVAGYATPSAVTRTLEVTAATVSTPAASTPAAVATSPSLRAQATVTVEVPATLEVGKSETLTTTGGSSTGSNIFYTKSVEICTVTSAGVVTAVSGGACSVYVQRSADGYTTVVSADAIFKILTAAEVKAAADALAKVAADKAAAEKAEADLKAAAIEAVRLSRLNTVKNIKKVKGKTTISMDLEDKYFGYILELQVRKVVKGKSKYTTIEYFAVERENGVVTVATKTKLAKGQLLRVRSDGKVVKTLKR